MSFDEDKHRRYTTTSSITLYPRVDDNGAIYSCEARHPSLERYLRCSVAINVLQPYFLQLTGVSLPEYQKMAPNVVAQIWQRCWSFTVDIVLQETPQAKVATGDFWRRRRPCCWKMTADHPCICEMLS
ncbi:hypothetical protein AVEN_211423-1 [Araneus ventricosus]|uniref:Ig-like domain-containing protein n=1 Tax=Araneus ventricosus TaxID=182803 RepID=A0A4Y2PT91_ARAVE|nr:hypothetical protein AVEN_36332-1 [Araneus ventricosus]GBN54351.1 hypothetical protein AVEN_211423-1 [Araneus ventricosus]